MALFVVIALCAGAFLLLGAILRILLTRTKAKTRNTAAGHRGHRRGRVTKGTRKAAKPAGRNRPLPLWGRKKLSAMRNGEGSAMGKPARRRKWWGYVKNCIRDYPRTRREQESADTALSGQARVEFDGVQQAIDDTLQMRNGQERCRLLSLVFWSKNRKTLEGAAVLCHISGRTAARWHNEFIRLTAFHMGLTDR